MKRVVCLILVLCGCRGTDTDPAPPSTVVDSELIHTLRFQSPDSTDSEGRRLAKLYCQSCHVFAEPELLDRDDVARVGAADVGANPRSAAGTGGLAA